MSILIILISFELRYFSDSGPSNICSISATLKISPMMMMELHIRTCFLTAEDQKPSQTKQ